MNVPRVVLMLAALVPVRPASAQQPTVEIRSTQLLFLAGVVMSETGTVVVVEDAMREVGTLLIAFAPLDAALAERPGKTGLLSLFMIVGVLLFIGSLLIERNRFHVK